VTAWFALSGPGEPLCRQAPSRPDVPGDADGPQWWQRPAQLVAASRTGSLVLARVLPRVDRALLSLSGGRASVPQLVAGIPVVELTTTGARTGRERTTPVLALRDGERRVLVASNWGRERHPAWYHNLRANPEVELTADGRTERYVAREATGDGREAYWEWAATVYPGFEAYRRRSGDRTIPVVVLEPVDDVDGGDDGDAGADEPAGKN